MRRLVVLIFWLASAARAQSTGGSFGGGSFGEPAVGGASGGTSDRTEGLPRRERQERVTRTRDDQLWDEVHRLRDAPPEVRARSAIFVDTLPGDVAAPEGPRPPEDVSFLPSGDRTMERLQERRTPRQGRREGSRPFAYGIGAAAFVLAWWLRRVATRDT